MLRRLASGAALVAVAVAMLAGCTPPEPVETTGPPTSSPTDQTPTPTSGARSDAQVTDQAFLQATAFNRLVDQGFREGTLPRAALEMVASPELIDDLQADLDQFTSRGLRLEGESLLESPTLVSHERAAAESGLVVIATCMDTSATTTVDSNGDEVSGGVERQPRLFELDYGIDTMIVMRTGPPEEPLELPGCGQ